MLTGFLNDNFFSFQSGAELLGTNGNDVLSATGDSGLFFYAGRGDDLINYQGSGYASFYGGVGNDVIIDHAIGYGYMSGGRGNDILIGYGHEMMLGGHGHDLFVLRGPHVHAYLMDFDPATDRIEVNQPVYYDPGSGALTNSHGHTLAYLPGDLHIPASDFIFA